MKHYKIAFDGPAGVGKSSTAKRIAEALGFKYIDSGAMYRAVGLYCYRNGISPEDEKNVVKILPGVKIDMNYENAKLTVYLNGEDVSSEIRTPVISEYASKVAVIGEVRKYLVGLQREMSEAANVIMDGRDIGTRVFPDADVKIFLTASAEERAKRRYDELGGTTPYEEILESIKFRDKNDSTRKIDPLRAADDAIVFDNSEYDLNETTELIIKIIKERIPCTDF